LTIAEQILANQEIGNSAAAAALDILTIAAIRTGSVNASVNRSFSWKEIRQ
jgi:hypothetical protein